MTASKLSISKSLRRIAPSTSSPGAAERGLRFLSAREVVRMSPAEVPWAVEGYVAAGAITGGIDGKPKAAGKTTFALHLCAKVLDGERFMGLATARTGVVYLTEQSATTFAEALVRAGLQDREDLAVLLWRDAVGAGWGRVVRGAVGEALRRGAGLLVVDTLPQFAGLRGDAENSASAALEAMRPLQETAAAHGLAVIVVRHERKSGGQVGDAGRGSSAFAGAVDVIVSVRRPEGNARPTVRELHALSRFDATPDELVVELTDEGYASLGTRAAVAEDEARAAILEALPEAESEAMGLNRLLEATGAKRTVAQAALAALLEAGRIVRVGEGVRGDPYRYRHAEGPTEDEAAHRPAE